MDNLLDALKIWATIKTDEGCEKTVNILKRIGQTDPIKKYLGWVLEKQPKIGLSLF
jgi:hypothetical protein